ncbi:tRNA (N(6)-L-threonylcarbamoyladenosine(37)-C(2))-methylthiotransferase MtaB [Chloroflexota bacterium]
MKYRARVAIQTLGCKLNQAESESLACRLIKGGHIIVDADEKPDVYILNSCTVTHVADRKCRNLIRRACKLNPQAKIVAMGCYAGRSTEELNRIDGIDFLANGQDGFDLIEMINLIDLPRAVEIGQSRLSRTRSFIKIQEGCDTPCTYCIVPQVRGKETSLDPEDILGEICERTSAGFLEVGLTGTKVGAYAYNGISLKDLIEQILKATDVKRLRLSSLQPLEVTDNLLSLWSDRRLCSHFHIPLQSGCQNVLGRMGRRYTTKQYEESISFIRERVPGVAITTDIMVGFPGETEDEHKESMSFCREMEFAAMHVFPYSSRPNTPATKIVGQVGGKEKRSRKAEMLKLAVQSARRFRERLIGHTKPVLWEVNVSGRDDTWSGLTDNYIRVMTRSKEPLSNRITMAKLESCKNGEVWGTIGQ